MAMHRDELAESMRVPDNRLNLCVAIKVYRGVFNDWLGQHDGGAAGSLVGNDVEKGLEESQERGE